MHEEEFETLEHIPSRWRPTDSPLLFWGVTAFAVLGFLLGLLAYTRKAPAPVTLPAPLPLPEAEVVAQLPGAEALNAAITAVETTQAEQATQLESLRLQVKGLREELAAAVAAEDAFAPAQRALEDPAARKLESALVELATEVDALASLGQHNAARLTEITGAVAQLTQELAWVRGEGPSHTVAEGETLSQIARRYGTTVDALVKLNPGIDPLRLHVGKRLRLPLGN